MLEHSLAEDQTAGAHLVRPATGAGWAFLLPSLALQTVVCLGRPAPTAAETLARISARVVVIDTPNAAIGELVALGADGAAASVDLVVVRRGSTARRLLRDERLLHALRACLSPRVVVYEESLGELKGGRIASALGVRGASSHAWLTPAFGEVRTAAPGYSSAAARWLRSARLDHVSVDERALIGLRTRYRARVRPAVAPAAGASGGEAGRTSGTDLADRRAVAVARRGIASAVRSTGRLEAHLARMVPQARRHGTLTGDDIGDALPAYIRRVADDAHVEVAHHSWALVAPGDYEAQKVLLFTFAPASQVPDMVVKLGRSEVASARLERAAAGLRALHAWPDLAEQRVPEVMFSGRYEAFAIVAESMVDGVPFQERTAGTADCPLVSEATRWLTLVGSRSAQRAPAAEAGQAMRMIVERLDRSYRMSPSHLDFLGAQADLIAAAGEIPAVFSHGDPGVWNLVATTDGGVAFLDWENYEPSAPPLWDLFYLLRSYAALAGRRDGTQDRLSGAVSPFVRPGQLLALIESSVESYCSEVGVPRSLVGPLFHMCWAMHAVKAGARLGAWDRERGAHVSYLRRMIDERRNPVLRRILEGTQP